MRLYVLQINGNDADDNIIDGVVNVSSAFGDDFGLSFTPSATIHDDETTQPYLLAFFSKDKAETVMKQIVTSLEHITTVTLMISIKPFEFSQSCVSKMAAHNETALLRS